MYKAFSFVPRVLPKGLEILSELALDLRWTWNNTSDRLWKTIEPEIWEQTTNPRLILQNIPQEHLEQLAQSPQFVDELQRVVKSRQNYLSSSGWFDKNYDAKTLRPVAYFSAEFGLGEALPLYAGGLGILAGDYLKTASDLNVPIVGIGLLYQEGYFRQILTSDGWQVEAYPYNDPTSLPISPALSESDEWLRVTLELPGRKLLLRVWQARMGRTFLYLLDSNDPLNSPIDRGIASKLYDERHEFRLLQEMVLGIAGWRVVESLGVQAEVCHLNEGHAAFVVLERARSFMLQAGVSFPVALWATRGGNVFTTHTPVSAGFDSFPSELVARYFHDYVASLGISMEQLLALGRQDPTDATEPFNMATLAMRGSTEVNGVSRLHGQVSRRIFQSLFPRWPERQVPVQYITNGVHVPSWDSEAADALWTQAKGEACWFDTLEKLAEAIGQVSDLELWALRTKERQTVVNYIRHRLTHQLQQRGVDSKIVEEARHVLDPNILTLGFAHRFTGYKRPHLLLHDAKRLIRMINHPHHPIQLIVAGKSHPQDEDGKRFVQQFVRFASQPAVRRRVVFLEDYDIALAEQLTQGIDLWVNTPRRTWEACGTSGMKILVNGGLNLSELDGWWAEAYTPEVGWALGDGKEHFEADWDTEEANQLYELLEHQIIPEFYDRDSRGVPVRWIDQVRASMAQLTPRFSTNRMLREYVTKVYVPATTRFRNRTANNAHVARKLHEWQMILEQNWSQIHFGLIQVQKEEGEWYFEVQVYFGELDPSFVQVEIYADPIDGQDLVVEPMMLKEKLSGTLNGYLYQGKVTAARPAEDFTVRIIPMHAEAKVPLEEAQILWQK